jgi:CspA family cold shock protein
LKNREIENYWLFGLRKSLYVSHRCLLDWLCYRTLARALDELFPSKIATKNRCAWGAPEVQIAKKGFVMITGTVKWFNSTKGFGFIQPDNGGQDAFVHISAVERAGMREIVEGQKISYELERDSKSGKMSATKLQAA